MLGGDGRRLHLSEVLADEIQAINGGPITVADPNGGPARPLDDVLEEAGRRAREQDPSAQDEAAAHAQRRIVYEQARRLNLSALCLSGGGIRSASVSLGVIQALVDKGLLRQFHYLSTVSGGGYIGSWLSAWLYHTRNADTVIEQLREKRSDSDHEPPPLTHLRSYSNYLTPRLGIFSADTWTAVAIVLRNLVVNWLILIPAIALPVVVVKLLATVLMSNSIADGKAVYLAGLCLLLGSVALGYKLHRLYAPPATRDTQVSQNRFILCSLVPAAVGGLCFIWLLLRHKTPVDALGFDFRIPWLDSEHSGRPFGPVLEFAVAVFIGALVVRFVDRKLSGAPPPVVAAPPQPSPPSGSQCAGRTARPGSPACWYSRS
jgi:patatin-like phospholipase